MGKQLHWQGASVRRIIGILINSIKNKKAVNKKTLFEKIGVGAIIFALAAQAIFVVTILFLDAYSVATKYVSTNEALRSELGNISGLGLVTSGGIKTRSDSSGQQGVAQLNVILKGDKKYREVTIYMTKSPKDTTWVLKEIR